MLELTQTEADIATTLPRVFQCELPLRFADMDADQHINNTEFYRDRKSTRLNSSHVSESRMPSSA